MDRSLILFTLVLSILISALIISFEYYEISMLRENGNVIEAVVINKHGPRKYKESFGSLILTNQNRWNIEYCYHENMHNLLMKGSFNVEKFKYDKIDIGSKITITYDKYSPSVSYIGDLKKISKTSILSLTKFPITIFLILLLITFHYIIYIYFVKSNN